MAYAQKLIKDPARKSLYEKKIRANKRTRDTSVYTTAIQAYMEKYSPKVARKKQLLMVCYYLETYPLSLAQEKGIEYLICFGKLTNAIYQELNKVSKPTATRHLQDLVKKGILNIPVKGAGAIYSLAALNGDSDSWAAMQGKELI